MELKDIIESQQKEVQSDPWLTPMFDPTISEEEKRIAINTIIEQTAQIVAREVLERAQKEIDHLSNYAQHDIQCITQFEEDEECDCGLIDIKK